MYPSPIKRERYADGVVHIVGLLVAAAACSFLLIQALAKLDKTLIIACSVYAASIMFSCLISAAYHQLPLHHCRKAMRRVDHAAIYAVIAGTFTPLLLVAGTVTAKWILVAAWFFAGLGILFKFFGSNVDARWSLASYLGLGWFGILALPDFWFALPAGALMAIGAGAVFYSVGTLFYRNKELRYRYSIWHSFGLAGAMCFFAAIWISLLR